MWFKFTTKLKRYKFKTQLNKLFLLNSQKKYGGEQFLVRYLFIDCTELPIPGCIIQERPVIKSVIIWTVTLHVYTWSQHCHFVPVDSVAPEKMFHLLCNLWNQRQISYYWLNETSVACQTFNASIVKVNVFLKNCEAFA